jgi:molybdenum cofactor guanylyltransferase
VSGVYAKDMGVKPTFTASLLAGGKSRRMGLDKALLRVIWQGVPTSLWKRQLSVLESLHPAEVLISGPRKIGYPESVSVIPDDWHDKGPLGGIATCLNRTHSDLLLILAVDLPFIQPLFLQTLLDRAKADCGVIPMHEDRFEPLVAVYPLLALKPALESLEMGDLVLQNFANRLLREKLVVTYRVEAWEQFQLENWNRPEDVAKPGFGISDFGF